MLTYELLQAIILIINKVIEVRESHDSRFRLIETLLPTYLPFKYRRVKGRKYGDIYMATKLRRDRVKYIRDKAKSKYEKDSSCYICGTTENLDFHHFYSMTPLLNEWLKEKQRIRPEHYTDEYIVIWRDEFIEENHGKIYDETVTLCHHHHLQLHKIYGKDPGLGTAKKQMRWVDLQREKNGLDK